MAAPINWEETSFLLTKEKYVLLQLDLFFSDLDFIDFTLYFSFWISTVNRSTTSAA